MPNPNKMIVCYASGLGCENTGVIQLIDLGPLNFAEEYIEILDLFKNSGIVSLQKRPAGKLHTKTWFQDIASWVAVDLYGDCNDCLTKVESLADRLSWLHTHGIIFDAVPNPRGPSWSEWGKLRLGNESLTVIDFVSAYATPAVEEIAAVLEGRYDETKS